MAGNLSPSEQLTYSTVRIEVDLPGGKVGTGTGFFFSFLKEGDKHVPAIVTNRHVVKGATKGRFKLHVGDGEGSPLPGQNVGVELDQSERRWVAHPDAGVDLCVFPTALVLREAKAQGKPAFFVQLDREFIPSDQELEQLTALEDVVMIGYPSGIWDSKNNMPIIRRGITATHPATDYEGRDEFMIDAACFPGSSGSPVFLFNVGSYAAKDGGIVIGSRIKLLGALYAGPQYTAEGEVKIVTVPTQQKVVAESKIPLNLGLVIKARRLLDFDNILRNVAEDAAGA